MLEAQHLSFSYNKKSILKDATLQVKKGEIVSILGPTGSGKTTLLHLLAGLLPKDSGSVTLEGMPLEKARGLISYMMQDDLLLPWRTVLGNLMLVKEFKKKGDKEEIKVQALALLKEVGLEGYEEYFPFQLSGGMKKRVALARALLLKRPLLFLDEPFGAIDPIRKESLYALLKKIQTQHSLTILFITHDYHDALMLSDRIYFLVNGKIAQEHLVEKEKGDEYLQYLLQKKLRESMRSLVGSLATC